MYTSVYICLKTTPCESYDKHSTTIKNLLIVEEWEIHIARLESILPDDNLPINSN